MKMNFSAILVIYLVSLSFTGCTVYAKTACKANTDCNEELVCEGGFCTLGNDVNRNPFATGCLRTMAGRYGRNVDEFSMRVCNSDDVPHSPNCLKPDFDYFETRMAPWNWETALIVGWVYQILLSEVFGVPATIEGGTGVKNTGVSFYDRESRLKYPDFTQETSLEPIEQLVEADRVGGDCSRTDKPCAHVMPEVRAGLSAVKPFIAQGKVLPAGLSGVNVRYGLYVPAHSVRRDPTLASFVGLGGTENRVKLAEIFKRPTNWSDYCELDVLNCSRNDTVASRKPETEKERSSYFLEDIFNGYFSSNKCDIEPKTCIGNVIAPNCQLSVYTETQLYWNNIPLASKGTMGNNAGYENSHMVQIYKAANATNSNVLFTWWEPDVLPTHFARSSNFSFHRVAFPNPSMECIMYRKSKNIDRCSINSTLRVGKQNIGSCDAGLQVFRKLTSTGFHTLTESTAQATRSPAFEFIKALVLDPYFIKRIFESWEDIRKENVVTDVEREGVCQFVYENLNKLLINKPKGYPRTFITVTYIPLSTAAYSMGSMTLVIALTTAALVYRWRKLPIIKYSKVNVLYLFTLGHGLIAISALISAVAIPTNASCVFTEWFMRLGYTLAIVPILIKVSAINKLTKVGMGCKRVEIDPNRFKKILTVTVCILFLFLVLWTSIDIPRKTEQYAMSKQNIADFNVSIGCESRRVEWKIVAYGWEFLLLLSATIITFQSRDVIQQLNESHSLTLMVYSHFMFVIVRVLTMVMDMVHVLPGALALKINSLMMSFDALFGMLIYVGPKFFHVITHQISSPNIESNIANRATERNIVEIDPHANARKSKTMSGKSSITGINIPRNSDGTIPRLIKPKAHVGKYNSMSSTGNGGSNNRLRNGFSSIKSKAGSAISEALHQDENAHEEVNYFIDKDESEDKKARDESENEAGNFNKELTA